MLRRLRPATAFALVSLVASSAHAQAADDDYEVPATKPPAPAPASSPTPTPTPAATSTPTPAATSTSTPTPAPAPTPAPTPTPAATSTSTPTPTPTPTPAPTPTPTEVTLPLGLRVTGYVQAELQWNQASQDELQQGGASLNFDRFLVRRARIRVERHWKYAETLIEIDGNTTRGPSFSVWRAEASLFYPGDTSDGEPPLAKLTAGLVQIPFGYEVPDSPRRRYFMERSTASLAFFPGQQDLGAKLSGGRKFFRYAIAVMNGEPTDDRPGRNVQELNRAKDVVAHLGFETKVGTTLGIAGGVSYLTGEGFHPGTGATKNGVIWRDLNENGSLDAGELAGLSGTAATPSGNFPRWGAGIDLGLSLRTSLGLSRLYGELVVGSNLDRGFFVEDPILTGQDSGELGGYGAFVQELTEHAFVGFRVDVYNPNADFFVKQAGKLVPANQTITTLSPIAGFSLPERARLTVQYDFVRDNLARDTRGVPTDLRNDQLTIRLQGEL